ncbi:helix-turn-helix domain-containing protein [Pseudoduganella sp. RAF53_2]|uniref:helix-turn-helix domain-containing protein n=1 Tax=unclassified Pseudoduganella TaxID=2637179 RepID=UPI003F964F6E
MKKQLRDSIEVVVSEVSSLRSPTPEACALHTDHPETFTPQFGGELFRLRQIAGLQQSALAKKSGLTRGYYGQLENSKKLPPPSRTVERISDALALTRSQRCRLACLALIERENYFAPLMSEALEAILKDLAFKADGLSTNQIRRIAEILEEVPSA